MDQRAKKLKRLFLSIFLVLLLFASVFLVVAFFRGRFGSSEDLRNYVASFGTAGPLVLTAIQTMQAFLPIIPSMFGFAAGTALFGVWAGFLCNYIGISLGSVIAYLLARNFGVDFILEILPEKKYNAAVQWATSKKSYLLVFFLSILLPLAPDVALCYFSGLIQIPFKKYVLVIIIAKPWCILAYSLLFGHLF